MDRGVADEWIEKKSASLGSRVGMDGAKVEGKSIDFNFIENCLEYFDIQYMNGEKLSNIRSKIKNIRANIEQC